ncbi:Dauer Up-regulated [Myxococcaceae bacterium GXIMD 01537]
MSRPVDNGAAAAAAREAARRAAEEAARRAAAEAARRAAAEAAARSQATQSSSTPQTQTRDQFSGPAAQNTARNTVRLDGGPQQGEGAGNNLPKDPQELPKYFPELKDKSKEDLKSIHDAMTKVVTGSFSEKATALGELAKTFPDTTGAVLEKLGVQDSKLAKLATNSDALKALGTLSDPKKTVADKAQAALSLAKATGDIFKPEDLQGVLGTTLKGLPAAEKLIGAITTWADPEKSSVEKAKATLELAKAVKEFAGEQWPQLSNDLRKLDGSLRAVGAAITLFDPSAKPEDRALAAAQLAAEISDLKKDIQAFADVLKKAGVPGAEQAARQGAQLAEVAIKGLDPKLASKLSAEQLVKLGELATKVGPENLEKVLGGITDPKVLESLTGQLSKLDDASAKRLLTSIGDLEHGVLSKVLSDPKLTESLGKLATKLDDESAKIIGRVAKEMDPEALGLLLKFTDNAAGDVLKTGLKGLAPILDKGGSKLVGQSLKVMDKLLGKMGVEITGEVAGKVFKNIAKAIPVAGAIPNAIDAGKYAMEAAELHGKNKDLGFFAMVGANLNVIDAGVGLVLDATGVGVAADIGVSVAFGAAELALDIAFSNEKAKMEADPQNYKAPDWMKAVNLAAAAAMGPSGMAQLAAYYGPEGAAELTQWGVEMGAKGAVELAKFAGVSTAEAAGDGLKTTAGFIHQMADVLRNPSKYGQAVAEKARDAYNAVIEKGGQLAEEAKKVIGNVVDEAKKLGQKGLDTLKFIAQNPGEAAKIAVNGLKDMISSGVDLATKAGQELWKKGVETLETLKAGWESLTGAAKEKAKELIEGAGKALGAAVDKAVELGEKGLEALAWVATHPGEAAEKAKEALTDVLAKGGEVAKKAWETIKGLGTKGLQLAESAIKGLQDAGAKAVETLKYIAENPGEAARQVRDWVGKTLSDAVRKGGEMAKDAAVAIKDFVDRRVDWAKGFARDLLKDGVAAFKDVAKAWKDNLTEGGKEVLVALKDLGDAGVDALKDLASVGGQLAQEAVNHLGSMAKAGIDAAKGALEGLAALGGEVGKLASGAFDTVKDLTDGEINIGPVHVDVNPLW